MRRRGFTSLACLPRYRHATHARACSLPICLPVRTHGGHVLLKQIERLMSDEKGAPLVEYGLVLGLVALAALVSLKTLGGKVNTMFKSEARRL
jgi:pilus assembly protein Flp/PilA